MLRTTGYLLWRLCRIIFGSMLLVFGLFLSIPGVPGPGIVVIVLSFAVLSRDFHWAERAHSYVKRKWHEVLEQRKPTAGKRETDHG
ncbi:MAG TPA: PGPGW domain-containing protein [Candidatus Binatia bacterium]|jgi:uncharacterized membrane protein|nr:PGPGW domain-containing protein [Candidatus Binatia bacterium]